MTRKPRSVPLRYQIKDFIIELLRREKYKPGDKIPTESELTDMLGISRSTLREGLHLLEEERVIRAKHGSGRYLLSLPEDLEFEITRLQSVTEMLAAFGIQVSTKVLGVKQIIADHEIAWQLQIMENQPVIAIERVRYAHDKPVIYSIDMISEDLLRDKWRSEDFSGSLLQILEENFNIFLDYSVTTIRAVTSDDLIPTEIEIDPNVPWIVLLQTNFTNLGKPIIYSKDYHRGDAVSFKVKRLRI
ncbi:MAG: GntR family transcriptional regulator [Anaerolineales bacterium]